MIFIANQIRYTDDNQPYKKVCVLLRDAFTVTFRTEWVIGGCRDIIMKRDDFDKNFTRL